MDRFESIAYTPFSKNVFDDAKNVGVQMEMLALKFPNSREKDQVLLKMEEVIMWVGKMIKVTQSGEC